MSSTDIARSLEAHKRWLGYLQPDGLVVSAAALVDRGHYYNEAQRQRQIEFIDYLTAYQTYDAENGILEVPDFKSLALHFLNWPAQEWIEAADLPDSLHLVLKESAEVLSPLAALQFPRSQRETFSENQSPYQLLIYTSGHPGGDFDAPYEVIQNTWLTSSTRRLERLLRATDVPCGLLISNAAVRLVYAPQGENPGHLTFRYADMLSTMGRPILGAFELLLGRPMLFLGDARNQLPALLRHSRTMQASVSAQLADQVLEALYELLRGFQTADARVHGDLLRVPMARNPDEVYHGLLTVLLRLVFLLFAEDRSLLPSSPLCAASKVQRPIPMIDVKPVGEGLNFLGMAIVLAALVVVFGKIVCEVAIMKRPFVAYIMVSLLIVLVLVIAITALPKLIIPITVGAAVLVVLAVVGHWWR